MQTNIKALFLSIPKAYSLAFSEKKLFIHWALATTNLSNPQNLLDLLEEFITWASHPSYREEYLYMLYYHPLSKTWRFLPGGKIQALSPLILPDLKTFTDLRTIDQHPILQAYAYRHFTSTNRQRLQQLLIHNQPLLHHLAFNFYHPSALQLSNQQLKLV